MKNCSADLLNLIPNPKAVNARVTFRLARPVFTASAVAGTIADPALVDSSPYGTGILQVANVGDVLQTRYVTDINGVWPAWTNTGISLMAGSRPGVDGQYVWYHKSTQAICLRDYANWAVETSEGSVATACFLAPISNQRCYYQYLSGGANRISEILAHNAGGVEWSGRVFGTTDRRLDAVTLNSVDYVYYMDRDAGRILEMSVHNVSTNQYVWGQPRSITPIDAIDDVYGLKLYHATVVNGQVVVTGRLTRTSDSAAVSMDVYLLGPEMFTFGRDLFITDQAVGGGLMIVGTSLIAPGAQLKAVAIASQLFGADPPGLKTTVSEIGNLRLTESEGRSSFFTLDLDPSLNNAAIAPGAEVTFEFAYNDEWMTVLTGEVDSIRRDKQEGETLQVAIISKSMKRLGQWSPDQGVYIPSQATAVAQATDLSQMIRVPGKWGQDIYGLKPTGFNEWNVAYTAARATRNGIMRAKFYNEVDEDRTVRNPRFGVGLNYFRETAAMTAARLGIDPDEVSDNQLGHNGLVAIYSRTEYDANTSGIALYSWVNNVMTQLMKVSVSLPHAPTFIWLQISFNEGLVKVDWRADGTTDWANLITYNLTGNYSWLSDTGGHGCILMQRQLLRPATVLDIDEKDDILAVESHSNLTASGTLLIDEELIDYTTKSTFTANSHDRDCHVEIGDGFRPGDTAFSADFPVPVYGLPWSTDSKADNFYRTAAAAIFDAEDAAANHIRTFRVMAFDPCKLSPYLLQWIPTDSFLPGWIAGIGDATLGSWVLQNIGNQSQYLYFDKDPGANLLGNMQSSGGYITNYTIYLRPALYGLTRGSGGTKKVSHAGGTALQYANIILTCKSFEFFTSDEDIMLADALKRVLVQAGGNCSAKFNANLTRTIPASTWDIIQIASHDLPDFIAEIDVLADLGDGFGVGMVFRSSVAVVNTTNGYYLNLVRAGNSLKVILYGNGTLLQTCVVDGQRAVGTVKVSVHGAVFSVWLNHVLLMSYSNSSIPAGNYKAFVANNPSLVAGKSVTYRVSELNDLLSDINVGVRGKGPNVLSDLLGDRAVYFRQEPDGSMYCYKTPTAIGTIADIIVGRSAEQSDTYVSRVRAEGVNVVETADFTALSDVGNIFETINDQYGNNASEILQDAGQYLSRLRQNAEVTTLATVLDPVLQPGDVYDVPEEGRPTTYQVVGTDFALGFQGDSFVADMQLQVIKP